MGHVPYGPPGRNSQGRPVYKNAAHRAEFEGTPGRTILRIIYFVVMGSFAAVSAYRFYVDRHLDKWHLEAILKPQFCEETHLDAGPYTHHDGITVDIPTAGVYRICTKAFHWGAPWEGK